MGPAVEITTEPSTYRIVYRKEELARDEEVRVSIETLLVRRPSDSRVERRQGTRSTDRTTGEQIAALGRLRTGGNEEAPLVLAVPPGPAPSDVRFDAFVNRAMNRGLVQRRELRQVLGRRCQVYRSGASLFGGDLVAPTVTSFADSCADDSGLVLEELVVTDVLHTRRIAIEIDEDVALADDLFATGDPTAPVRQGGGSVQAVVPSSTPIGDFWQLDQVPEGFEHVGRYGVIPPQPETFADPLREGQIIAGVADVWRRGPDILVVDQGATLRGAPPFPADDTNPTVDAGAVGTARERLSPQGPELRVLREGGKFVRVLGTLTVDELAAVARSLRLTQGTGLVYP